MRAVEIELRSTLQATKAGRDAERHWRATGDLLRGVLNQCETGGHFVLRPREQTTVRGQERLRLRNVHGQAIRLASRPSDNGSAWEYDLVPPGDVDADALLQQMLLATNPPKVNGNHPAPVAAVEAKPVPVEPQKPKLERSLLQRVGELESAKARLEERKQRIVDLDRQKAKLLAEVAAIDAESLRLVEEDERDVEAYEAAEIIAGLEKLFKKG